MISFSSFACFKCFELNILSALPPSTLFHSLTLLSRTESCRTALWCPMMLELLLAFTKKKKNRKKKRSTTPLPSSRRSVAASHLDYSLTFSQFFLFSLPFHCARSSASVLRTTGISSRAGREIKLYRAYCVYTMMTIMGPEWMRRLLELNTFSSRLLFPRSALRLLLLCDTIERMRNPIVVAS